MAFDEIKQYYNKNAKPNVPLTVQNYNHNRLSHTFSNKTINLMLLQCQRCCNNRYLLLV